MNINSYKNKELRIWSVFVMLLWMFLSIALVFRFFNGIIPILKDSYNFAAEDFSEFIEGLLLFTPIFMLTEEVPILRNTFKFNPSLRPAFAFTLVYISIFAFVQLSYALFSISWISLMALIIGRLIMCFIFYKHPLDRFKEF